MPAIIIPTPPSAIRAYMSSASNNVSGSSDALGLLTIRLRHRSVSRKRFTLCDDAVLTEQVEHNELVELPKPTKEDAKAVVFMPRRIASQVGLKKG